MKTLNLSALGKEGANLDSLQLSKNGDKICQFDKLAANEVNRMERTNEKGFSLVELLLVVVIVGIVAAMAVPAFQKGLWAAENSAAYSALRTIHSTQVDFFVQNNRFARLAEINPRVGNALGTVTGDRIVRGRYVFEMTPVAPTDAELATEYVISATRAVSGDTVYKYEITQSGRIRQVFPAGGSDIFEGP